MVTTAQLGWKMSSHNGANSLTAPTCCRVQSLVLKALPQQSPKVLQQCTVGFGTRIHIFVFAVPLDFQVCPGVH